MAKPAAWLRNSVGPAALACSESR